MYQFLFWEYVPSRILRHVLLEVVFVGDLLLPQPLKKMNSLTDRAYHTLKTQTKTARGQKASVEFNENSNCSPVYRSPRPKCEDKGHCGVHPMALQHG